MPRRVQELIKDLEQAGYTNRGGKGSHRNFTLKGAPTVTISGKAGADAKRYQEAAVTKAIIAAKLKNS